MKKLVSVILAFVLCMSFAGCNTESNTDKNEAEPSGTSTEESLLEDSSALEGNDETVAVRIGALKGPTAMGMVKMMSDSDAGNTGNNDYTFTISASTDEITPAIVKGDLDIAAVPANMASVLYNKTQKDVTVLAVNTLGVLYICENGSNDVQSIEDLKGKTIYAAGKGATPEYALDYLLEQNSIDPDNDVTIEWKSEHAECVSALLKNKDAVAMIPEPFVTSAKASNSDISVSLDLTEEWDKIQSEAEIPSTLLTGVVIARNEFIEEHPEAVSLFMEQYASSVDYVNDNIDDAADLIENYDIIKAEIAKEAIPNCNITFMEGSEMKDKLSGYLSVLYDENPKSVGGTLPDDAFYYSR